MARSLKLTFLFFIFATSLVIGTDRSEIQERGLSLEKLENITGNFVVFLTKSLASFNDRHFGKSDFGKLLNYEQIKPDIDNCELEESRGMKKMAMGMLPLVFHVGATSTWMALTTILAAKAVLIGIILLVFKIAVSSAKVASFFTSLKGHAKPHHDWTPHEHHDYDRSL